MPRQHRRPEGGEASGKAVWDTGSSLYDSYELAAVRRLIDRRLFAGVRPLHEEPAPAPEESQRDDESKQQVVAVSGAGRAGRKKKVTLRVLFRAAVSWAMRIKPKQAHACACVVLPQGGGAVEPVVSSHGYFQRSLLVAVLGAAAA